MVQPADYKTIGIVRSSARTSGEKKLAKDLDAYKRIRKQGLQPKGIDGCAELEAHANNRLEIEMGHLFPTKEEWGKAKEGMAMAEEIKENMKLERIQEEINKRGA